MAAQPVLTLKDWIIAAIVLGGSAWAWQNRFRRAKDVIDPAGGATATPYTYDPGYYGDVIGGTDYNPDPDARTIHDTLEGYTFFPYPSISDLIVNLDPQELIALYNHYNANYAEDYPTLTQLLRNEYHFNPTYVPAVYYLESAGLMDFAPNDAPLYPLPVYNQLAYYFTGQNAFPFSQYPFLTGY